MFAVLQPARCLVASSVVGLTCACRLRSLASASTWSLERLDALAAEVASHLVLTLGASSGGTPAAAAGDDTAAAGQPDWSAGNGEQHSSSSYRSAAAAAAAAAALGADFGCGSDGEDSGDGYEFDQKPSGLTQAVFESVAADAVAEQEVRRQRQAKLKPSGRGQRPDVRQMLKNIPGPPPSPLQLISALNTVLFERHGYGPCNRYGDPRCALLQQGAY